MFKGTDKLMPGDIDRATQRNGGQNNAYTTEDMTVYHFDFAADRWQIALDIEADRMRNIRIDAKHEFEQEKGAVIAELAGNEDSPWDLEYKAILPLLFPKDSPYSHPVIGEEKHVRGGDRRDHQAALRQVVPPEQRRRSSIVGGFDPDEALTKIKKLFGPIPKGDLPPRKTPTVFKDRERAGPQGVRVQVRRAADADGVQHASPSATPDDPVLDVVQHVLRDGTTSRLYRKLVEDERIASAVDRRQLRRPLPRLVRRERRVAQGEGPQEGRGDGLRGTGEAGGRAGHRRGTGRAPAEDARRGSCSPARASTAWRTPIARASTYPGGEDVAKFFQRLPRPRARRCRRPTCSGPRRSTSTASKARVVWSVPKDEEKSRRSGGGEATVSDARPTACVGRHRRDSRTARMRSRRRRPARFSLTAAKRGRCCRTGSRSSLLEDHRLPIVVGRPSTSPT